MEDKILEIRRIYSQAEIDLITRIANKLKRGKTLSLSDWERSKLLELRQFRNGVNQQIISHLQNVADERFEELIELAYQKGSKSAIDDLLMIKNEDAIQNTLLRSDVLAIRAIATEFNERVAQTHLRILRTAEDYYRQAVANGVEYTLTGAGTRLEGAQKTLNELADKGVTGFVDKAGRNWNLSSYVEMATRTATGRAKVDGNINRFTANGEDLVIVSGHFESCPICDPWEGRILSISGTSQKYASTQEAIDAGLFHPNCTHNFTLYVDGLTDPKKVIKQKKDQNLYEERQQQRYNERMIRKWKRRKAASLTEEEAKRAQAFVSKWQSKQRDLVDRTGRRRMYGREQLDTAR